MIEIKWSETSGPNGIVTQYILERKLANGTNTVVVANFTPSVKSYIDESRELSPFTTYSYRLKVVNGAGSGFGPWANITTSASRK